MQVAVHLIGHREEGVDRLGHVQPVPASGPGPVDDEVDRVILRLEPLELGGAGRVPGSVLLLELDLQRPRERRRVELHGEGCDRFAALLAILAGVRLDLELLQLAGHRSSFWRRMSRTCSTTWSTRSSRTWPGSRAPRPPRPPPAPASESTTIRTTISSISTGMAGRGQIRIADWR